MPFTIALTLHMPPPTLLSLPCTAVHPVPPEFGIRNSVTLFSPCSTRLCGQKVQHLWD
jgi:hypothetical protein